MPIYVPEADKVGLGQTRGSAITPVDTYAPPAVQRGDGGLGELANSLSKLGVSFENIAGEQARKKEEADLRNVEYFAGQVRGEIREGVPYAVQVGNLLPEQSATVRARVEESLGYDRGVEWARAQQEALLGDIDVKLNPEAYRAKVEEIRRQAAAAVRGNPSWGAGYMKAVEGVLNESLQSATSQRTTIMNEEQVKQFNRDLLSGIGGAGQNTPVKWKTVGQADTPLANLQGALAEGKSAEHVANLKYDFGSRLDAMIGAMPPELRNSLKVSSGYRSESRQAEIYQAALTKYGSESAARKWAAPPGKSNHNHGEAVDLAYADDNVKQWVHANAEKYGLYFPLKNEPWHIEMRGGRREGGTTRYEVADADGSDDRNDMNAFVQKVVYRESGGDPYAENPNSSASGMGQFLDGTWLDVVRKYGPAEVKNLPEDAILRLKTDPGAGQLQYDMVLAYARENSAVLERKGLPVTEENLDLMHFAGATGGVKLLTASDTAKVGDVLGPAAARANPKLAKLTVAELKADFARKRGDDTDLIRVSQNAIRQVDRNWQVSGGLPNVVRRDAAAKFLQQMALDKGDESYLDRLPPEWRTPEIEAQFTDTRRKVSELRWQEHQRNYALQEQKLKEETRQYKWEIDQSFANGQPVDPRKWANNNEAFQYALQMQRTEQFIAPDVSQANADRLSRDIEAAAWKGDYGLVMGEAFKGRTATLDELQTAVQNRGDIKAQDKIELMKKLPVLVNAGAMIGSDESQQYFNRMLGDDLKTLQQSLFAKANPLNTVNFEGAARRTYETTLQTLIRAYVEDNDRVPTGSAKVEIYNKALEAAETKIEKLKKESPMGQAMDRGSAVQPVKPEGKSGSAGAPSGYTFEKRPDGKVEIKPNTSATNSAGDGVTLTVPKSYLEQVGEALGDVFPTP